MFPKADVPVVQLAINGDKADWEYHLEPRRTTGAVARARRVDHRQRQRRAQPAVGRPVATAKTGFDWAQRFDEDASGGHARRSERSTRSYRVMQDLAAPRQLRTISSRSCTSLAWPTPRSRAADVFVDGYADGSLSMTAYTLDAACPPRPQAEQAQRPRRTTSTPRTSTSDAQTRKDGHEQHVAGERRATRPAGRPRRDTRRSRVQKLFGWLGGHGLTGTAAAFEQMGFQPGRLAALAAGLGETGGGVLLALGLATPAAGAAAAGTMIPATAVHAPSGFFATGGGYEYPALLGVSAAALTLMGPGNWSLDARLNHRLNRPWMAAAAIIASSAVSLAIVQKRRRVLADRAAEAMSRIAGRSRGPGHSDHCGTVAALPRSPPRRGPRAGGSTSPARSPRRLYRHDRASGVVPGRRRARWRHGHCRRRGAKLARHVRRRGGRAPRGGRPGGLVRG